MARNDEKKSIRCSFCGKHQDQVQRMIAGPGRPISATSVSSCAWASWSDDVRPAEEGYAGRDP